MTDTRMVFITCPEAEADRLARGLVAGRLAACVNRLERVQSVYRWQGEVVSEPESLLIAKTTTARLPELSAWLTDEHPYSVPELLALPVDAGLPDYLDWVRAETTDPE